MGLKRQVARVGLCGTGFIASQLARLLQVQPDLRITRVLSRRAPGTLGAPWDALDVVRSTPELLDGVDIVVECSGHPLHAAAVIDAALDQGLPVVTMNAEFHVTCGSAFVGRGYLSEAAGDQPGTLAQMDRELRGMGFEPLVYGNLKGFLDRDPQPQAMQEWSQRLGVRLEQVSAFTDGTKVQIEQALVANGLDADIACDGLLGLDGHDRHAAALELASRAQQAGRPLSDYLLAPGLPPGVFIAATHATACAGELRALKMGDGPVYVLERPFHLCALEIPNSLRAALSGAPVLLDNSDRPRVGVAAIARRDLAAGHPIERAMGGTDLRGEAVRMAAHPQHVPIGVLFGARLVRPVERGQMLSWADVELPDSKGVRMARRAMGLG